MKIEKPNMKMKTVLVYIALICAMAAPFLFLKARTGSVASSGIAEREIPIYCVDTDEKKVSISFDAAWGNEDTQDLLDILERYQVHATFFMTGGWIESYPEDVKAIYAAGHDLGNHSETHPDMTKISSDACVEQIMGPHEKVYELTGYNMCLIRPPYGAYNDTMIAAAEQCGYYTIQWSCDSLDWRDYTADVIQKNILQNKHLENGAIILLHNGGKHTAEALPGLIEGLQDMGYEIVPISELIYTDNYEIDHTGKQIAK